MVCHHNGRPFCLLPSREVAGVGGEVVAIIIGETWQWNQKLKNRHQLSNIILYFSHIEFSVFCHARGIHSQPLLNTEQAYKRQGHATFEAL